MYVQTLTFETIDISSIITKATFCMAFLIASSAMSESGEYLGVPLLCSMGSCNNRCIVKPPILKAAMPVGARMATSFLNSCRVA